MSTFITAIALDLTPCFRALRFGPTLHLTSSAIESMFPRAFERIGVGFYRSKITSWMAAQEEDYRCSAFYCEFVNVLAYFIRSSQTYLIS